MSKRCSFLIFDERKVLFLIFDKHKVLFLIFDEQKLLFRLFDEQKVLFLICEKQRNDQSLPYGAAPNYYGHTQRPELTIWGTVFSPIGSI